MRKPSFVVVLVVAVLMVTLSGLEGSARTLRIWTFVDTHADFFEAVKEQMLEADPSLDIEITVSQYDALYDRLTVVGMAGGDAAPDLVDVEQGAFGRFVGPRMIFEPLNPYLEREGYQDAIAQGRQALYSYGGNVYGLEHALTPVLLYYRADMFEEYGIETPITTWDQFQEVGVQLLAEYGQALIAVADTAGRRGYHDLLLRQIGQGFADENAQPNIRTEEFARVARMLQDWRDLGIAVADEGSGELWRILGEGEAITLIGADWHLGMLRAQVPDQAGQWAVMPLPVFDAGNPASSVWGGTGLAIMRSSRQKDLAWEYMRLAQLNRENAITRFDLIGLYPPLLEAFDGEELKQPVDYFGGQRVGELIAEVIEDIPVQNPAPWQHLYAEAYEMHFFDFMNGRITAEEFRDLVADELDNLIRRQR